MSTSSSPAPDPRQQSDIRPFPYGEATGTGQLGLAQGLAPAKEALNRDEELREAARKEGESQARAVFERELAQVRDSVRTALSDFARQRVAYFQQVEAEVVRLALGIARKILHREAQVDPLLLAGMVRVALEAIERGTRIVVRVNPAQLADCRSYFAQNMDPAKLPEVVDDAALEPDHCVLETNLGVTDVGMEVQFKEIERGLLDLLARRPQSNP